VAYETELEFASEIVIEVASEHLGETMAQQIEEYRQRLDETPVELRVRA
jgi:hypothetical protein